MRVLGRSQGGVASEPALLSKATCQVAWGPRAGAVPGSCEGLALPQPPRGACESVGSERGRPGRHGVSQRCLTETVSDCLSQTPLLPARESQSVSFEGGGGESGEESKSRLRGEGGSHCQ